MDSNILAWYNVEVCKNSFKMIEVHESNKKEIQKRSSDEEGVANLQNLSNEVLNHLESFKFYSDEEFDGFNI